MVDVLLIEDDDYLRRGLGDALTRAGHAVREAGNGAAGLKQFDAAAPEIVITDIIMDDGEGIGTIGAVRQRSAEVPVIAISGNPVYLEYSAKLGADRTLLKPCVPDDLLDAIEALTDGAPSPARAQA